VLSQGKYAFACIDSAQAPTSMRSPVEAFQTVAVLSVDPAMKNSPSGDQARSYTCLVVTLRGSAGGIYNN
jgi:hypothetical protein